MARDLPLPVASLLAASLALLHTVAVELPLAEFGRVEPPAVPFSDAGAAACAVLVAAALLAGIVHGGLEARRWAVIVAGGVIAYAIAYEVYAWAVVVLWVSLGIAAVVAAIVDHGGARLFGPSGLVMVVLATLVGVGIVAPPSRLVVSDAGMAAMTALETAAALASLVLGYAALAWSERTGPWRRWFEAAVGIALVYLCSVAVVDAFTVQVGGAVPAEELQRQGQVALSVTWTVLGLAAFVAGLWFRWADMRIGGLALLALATAKVFLVDLSALDVAYRVVSLVVLGLILLAAAWLWQRMRPHPPGEIPRAA